MTHKFLMAVLLCAAAVCGETSPVPPSAFASGRSEPVTVARPVGSLGAGLPRPSRAPATQSQLVWQRLQFPLVPPPRIGFGLTFDSTTQKALLFGGYHATAGKVYFYNDLWSTDGHQWTQISTPSQNPIERTDASFAYDGARQVAVLFGGAHNDEILGSTWTYRPFLWHQQFPPASPPPRVQASMAYDPARKVTLRFGGEFPGGPTPPTLNDLWAWDGTSWQQKFPATVPLERSGANMVYDRARQNIVLFGGGVGGGLLDDTWIWDGTNWAKQSPAHRPPARANFGMAYDEGRQQVILFGGQAIGGEATGTWAWDGQDWTQLPTRLAPPFELAYDAQLVYLPELQTVVLVGDFRQKDCPTASCTFIEETQVWGLTDRYLSYLPMTSC